MTTQAMTDERLEHLRQIAGGIDSPKSDWMDELIDEIDRLRAIVGQLQKTVDGVPVTPGMNLWRDGEDWVSDMWANKRANPKVQCNPASCYSTRDAAEQAGKGRKP